MPTCKRSWRELGRLGLVDASSQGLEERVSLYTRQSFTDVPWVTLVSRVELS